MLTLDTLNVMLAVSEEGLIEEVVITLLASPQLAAFFEKFPKLRKAMTDDLPRWRDNLRQRFKDGSPAGTDRGSGWLPAVPAAFNAAVYCPATANSDAA